MEIITNRIGIPGAVESLIGGRNENQDDFGFAETALGMLVVVCDGMGGGPAGRTASGLACETIIRQLKTAKMNDDPETVLYNAVIAANNALLGAIAAKPDLQGMGTTCVCLLVNHKYAYIAHVGDSRCYQLRNGQYVFRTADHSYVAELVRHKTITEEEARQSRYSNVITRAIGVGQELEPEIDKVSVKSGDRFALMTDGIWGSMCEKDLVRYLVKEEDIESLVSGMARVVDQIGIDEGGGHDNLTLAMVQLPADVKQQAPVETLNQKVARQLKQAAQNKDVPKMCAEQKASKQPVNDSMEKGDESNRDQDIHITITELADEKTARRKNIWIWILSVLLLVVIGVLIWLLFLKDDNDVNDDKTKYATVDNRNYTKEDAETRWESNYKKDDTSSDSKSDITSDQSKDKTAAIENIAKAKDKDITDQEIVSQKPDDNTALQKSPLSKEQTIIIGSIKKLRSIIDDYHNAPEINLEKNSSKWNARQNSIKRILKEVSQETKGAKKIGDSEYNKTLNAQIREINRLSDPEKKLLDDKRGRPSGDTEKDIKSIIGNLKKLADIK